MNETQKIPAGAYRGKGIAGSDQTGHTSKGTEQLAVDLQLLDLGRRVTTFLSFSEAAAPFSIERLQAMGWTGENDGQHLVGIDRNEVTVILKYEEYQGKLQMRVDILTTRGFSFDKPMNDQEKRGFFSRLNDLAKKQGAATKPGPDPWDAPAGGKPGLDLG